MDAFVNAYLQSDLFGKVIFFALFSLSGASWSVLIYKAWQLMQVRRLSRHFSELFAEKKEQPLHFQVQAVSMRLGVPHPFFEVYKSAKQTALQLLRNRTHFQPEDVRLIESHTFFIASSQSKALESNLYLLSTIATLGPFFGLLGTVWGILVSLSQMPKGSVSNAVMLSGLSMALATTVIGLLIAIPAVVGFNWLKNAHREYKRELDHFTHLLLAAIEIQHRSQNIQ